MESRNYYVDRMPRDSKVAHLSNVRMFSALTKRELATVAQASDEVSAEAGQVLVKEGSIGHEFFLILEGTATVRRNGRKVATLGPGQYFGELAVLDRAPRNATVVADGPMQLLVLAQREFSTVLDTVPGVAHKLLRSMATRLREADAKDVTT
jgi:CRP/FNR family transcriptional regulator, cyclic AMP receptor protein